MKVTVSEAASAAVRTLSPDERRRAFAWFQTLENWENDEFTRSKSQRLDEDDALYALHSSSDFRILFRLAPDEITILDVVWRETLRQYKALKERAAAVAAAQAAGDAT